MTEKNINIKNIILYGIGDIYGGGAFIIIGTLFIIFLTDVVGLSPAKAGLVLVIGKVWDAISDPLMGYLSDNTRTRFGRRRIYFIIAIIPVALSFFLLWYPVKFTADNYLFLYYVFAYLFFSTIFTMVMVPYSALNADMTRDFKVRTKLSGARMIFSQFSALLAGVLPKIIINYFSQTGTTNFSQSYGYMIMGLIFGIFYALPWIFVFSGTRELPLKNNKNSESFFSKIKTFKSVFINKSFRIHLGMYICAYVAMDFLMALFVYFLNYYLKLPDLFPYCMLAILATQILTLPVYIKICNKYHKGIAYISGLSIWGISMLLLFFLGPTTPTIIIITICIFIGAGLSAGVMVPWAILPSITDVDEIITRQNRTGVYSGMMTLIRKLAQAIALGSVGTILALIGYLPNQQQTPATLFKLKLVFILLPVILIITGILFARNFRITPQKHEILINEIKRINEGGKRDDITLSSRDICEELTGVSYHKFK